MPNPAKPTELKKIENNPGKRPINHDEPEPTLGMPPMPDGLSPNAKRAWTRIGKLVEDMGVMTHADSLALERLAGIYSEMISYQKLIESRGEIIETGRDNGDMVVKANPAVAMLADADRRFRNYLNDFGLTPASRSKVKIQKGKKKDPLDDYFGPKH